MLRIILSFTNQTLIVYHQLILGIGEIIRGIGKMKIKTFIASCILGCGLVGGVAAKAEMIKGLPDAIRCGLPSGDTYIVYLSGLLNNGNAVYFSPSGKQFLNITPEGVLVREGANCHGKTIDELRNEGSAFDLVR